MARIAGDNRGYTFHLVRTGDVDTLHQMTEWSFDLDSVTTVIGDVLGKPAGAMAWWGFRLGLEGVAKLGAQVVGPLGTDAEAIEAALKEEGIDPNKATDKAGSRGSTAHYALECLAEGRREEAEELAAKELEETGARYCEAVISWWDDEVADWAAEGAELEVVSERPVWSLRHGYCGTLDLGIKQVSAWELIDLKTHKPARGFTKPGQGPAYLSDILQIRAYRTAWREMGLGDTAGQRVVIARENGQWLEDRRQVPEELWLRVLEVYRLMQAFEEGE